LWTLALIIPTDRIKVIVDAIKDRTKAFTGLRTIFGIEVVITWETDGWRINRELRGGKR